MPWILVLWVTLSHRQKCDEILVPFLIMSHRHVAPSLRLSQEAPRCCKDYDNTPTCFKIEEKCHYQNVIPACMLAAFMSVCCLCYQGKKKKKSFMHKHSLSNLFPPTISS